ncbi:MAG: zinc-dependent peptidase [Gammaproteobacteria bacterium]|nr:zinc-dependent peptidase [Gammaproteobacteria bacterium]
MFARIRYYLDRRIIKASKITPLEWQSAFDSLPLLDRLSANEKTFLRELAILFIHRKTFEGAKGFVVTLPMALIISLQACLPVLKLGLDCYAGWSVVIVYASAFMPTRSMIDEFGVEHTMRSNLAGESWQQGPVILAWDEAEVAGIIDGHNLIVHEFAHKLDMQNGVANGFPPLHVDMHVDDWVEAFTAGFKDLQHRCRSGKFNDVDCYAATSPAEFFAVLSEIFFERPSVLKHYYKEIYAQLRAYYRQDPLRRMSCRNKTATIIEA